MSSTPSRAFVEAVPAAALARSTNPISFLLRFEPAVSLLSSQRSGKQSFDRLRPGFGYLPGSNTASSGSGFGPESFPAGYLSRVRAPRDTGVRRARRCRRRLDESFRATRILDLGAGTGETARRVLKKHPERPRRARRLVGGDARDGSRIPGRGPRRADHRSAAGGSSPRRTLRSRCLGARDPPSPEHRQATSLPEDRRIATTRWTFRPGRRHPYGRSGGGRDARHSSHIDRPDPPRRPAGLAGRSRARAARSSGRAATWWW